MVPVCGREGAGVFFKGFPLGEKLSPHGDG